VKKAELQLPDALYQQVEGLAAELRTTGPELMRKAVEQLVFQRPKPQADASRQWQFPEAHVTLVLSLVQSKIGGRLRTRQPCVAGKVAKRKSNDESSYSPRGG
jgi:hypothetical protein